jgi:hypothetical protein
LQLLVYLGDDLGLSLINMKLEKNNWKRNLKLRLLNENTL